MSTSPEQRGVARTSFGNKTRRRGGGQALVEFALIVPLILVISLAVFDFGRAIYAYNTISNASRAGTRTAIVNQYVAAIKARASAQATALGVDPSADIDATFLGPGGSGSCATIVVFPEPCVAVVTVRYRFVPITPIIGQLTGTINLAATSSQPIESKCTTSGCPVP